MGKKLELNEVLVLLKVRLDKAMVLAAEEDEITSLDCLETMFYLINAFKNQEENIKKKIDLRRALLESN